MQSIGSSLTTGSPPESELINERSVSGQSLRLSKLAGKKVLFIACGGDISKYGLYVKAKELGIRSYVVEEPDNRLAKLLTDDGIIEAHIKIDLNMRSTIVEDCKGAIDTVLSDPDAVTTFWDDAVGLTARLATLYDVITNSVEAVDTCHDKYLTRCKLEQAGLPIPRYSRVKNIDEMKEAVVGMTFPAILKPVQGAASIGVSLVQDEADAMETYIRSVKLMEEVIAGKELMGLVFEEGVGGTTTFVLEEFIDGEEVDVDMCLRNGELIYSNINSDWPVEGGRFIETGISFPAKCNETDRGREFRRCALQCCQAIGIRDGVVHVEMKYSSRDGPTLVELNPRIGGGPLYSFHKRAFGVDLVCEHLLVLCGYPSNPPALETHAAVCSCLFLYAPLDGVCDEDMCAAAESIAKRDHVISVKYSVCRGDRLVGWDNLDSYPSYLGRVDIAVDRDSMSYDEVIQYCIALRHDASAVKYR
eukprot:GHVH01002992.1.p1 GENE.GHVH01002992.1~~GHVH01002992.1.p1  ORF type:complete len:474 (+),score=57.93 GHVH01002992.1:194-1615(+)